MARPPRQPLPLRKKLLFSAIMFLLVAGLVEVAARLLGAQTFPPNPYRDSALELEWELKPSARTRWSNDQIVETNSLGFRSAELAREKPAAERRLLFLGDSVAFGYRVAQDETVPHHLEQALPGGQWHVMNASAEGYNQFSYLQLLRHRGLAAQPDAVLVSFVVNDVYEPYLNMRRYGAQGYFARRGTLAWAKDLARLSAAFCAVERVYIQRQLDTLPPPGPYVVQNMFRDDPPPEIEEGWREALANLAATRDMLRDHGLPILVVAFPTRYQFDSADPARLAPQRRLLAFCEAEQIPLIDLYTELRLDPLPVDDLLMDEIHLRPAGARHVARLLARRLAEAGLLAEPPPGGWFTATAPWREAIHDRLRAEGALE